MQVQRERIWEWKREGLKKEGEKRKKWRKWMAMKVKKPRGVRWGRRREGGSRGRGHRRTFCRFFSCINLDTLWAVHVFQFREVFLNCLFNEFLPPVLCHLSCKTDLWADSLWFWIFSSPSAIFCCCCCCCCYFEGSFPFLSLRPSFLWMPSLLGILFLFLNVVS